MTCISASLVPAPGGRGSLCPRCSAEIASTGTQTHLDTRTTKTHLNWVIHSAMYISILKPQGELILSLLTWLQNVLEFFLRLSSGKTASMMLDIRSYRFKSLLYLQKYFSYLTNAIWYQIYCAVLCAGYLNVQFSVGQFIKINLNLAGQCSSKIMFCFSSLINVASNLRFQ